MKKEASTPIDTEVLQMAVKAVNDSVSPDGLVPRLLFYRPLPRLGLRNDQQAPCTYQRATALRKATEAMTRHIANRQARNAFSTRNGPDVTDIYKTPSAYPVLVYRPQLWR